MSIETDFRAALAAHAPLTALVGTRIALNAVPDKSALPLVVYSAQHNLEHALDGAVLADQCTLAVQCWGETSAGAEAVADAVTAALAGVLDVTVLDRASSFDADLGLDATTLTVEWWDTSP